MQKLLVGMLHLPALPGAPAAELPLEAIEERALAEARTLQEAGFDAAVLENFGDAPFFKDRVGPETIAAMARVATRLRSELPGLALGINVLRNDARAALAVAAATGCRFVRVNVHVGATATDQGIIEGRAAESLRYRQLLGSDVAIWADVHVKHGRSLAHEKVADEAEDAVRRGLASALIVSGRATGAVASLDDVRAVQGVGLGVPLYLGSGVTEGNVKEFLSAADGVIVGTSLKRDGRTTAPIDAERACRFVAAARR
jgi:membrane complex biogenesis BtpA family protein